MRREITGIILFFMVIFTLISLISYHPADPCLNNVGGSGPIRNLFGAVGAQVAGLLVGLFGLGAFWIPLLLLLASVHFFVKKRSEALVSMVSGALLLIVATGCLLSFKQDTYQIFGRSFSAGGIIGILLGSVLVRYTGSTGAVIIATVFWLIGFILSTGFSLVAFGRRCHAAALALAGRLETLVVKWKERRAKARRRARRLKAARREQKPKIEIKAPRPKPTAKPAPPPRQQVFKFMQADGVFQLPPFSFLEDPQPVQASADRENLEMQSRMLEKKLEDFGVHGKVVAVTPGPVITTYEYAPAAGVKINRIVNLTDDLALALRAASIRIVAPIPGKAAIGIEVPNANREIVRFKEVVASQAYQKSKSKLTLCLGKDVVGNPVVTELDKMPHLLIAGATGAGKSVALNTMICSILYKATPDEVKLIMVDPKRIELSLYDGIPHLITPVVTDARKATNALNWAVREMERRYELLSRVKARNIIQYNRKLAGKAKNQAPDRQELPESLPYLVVIIDELADLMMVASKDVEVALTRLAQMARAAGIHLILATQRPSVDVLTGIIKANFPTRLTFQVSSKTDSRTIIDTNGAENLLGMGDMLFMPPGAAGLQRIHGAFMSEEEVTRICEFLKQQKPPEYDTSVVEAARQEEQEDGRAEYDERYDEAVALVTRAGQASISMIQRHLRIGYNRAARIIEVMEKEGIVGPADGAKPRQVLARNLDDLP